MNMYKSSYYSLVVMLASISTAYAEEVDLDDITMEIVLEERADANKLNILTLSTESKLKAKEALQGRAADLKSIELHEHGEMNLSELAPKEELREHSDMNLGDLAPKEELHAPIDAIRSDLQKPDLLEGAEGPREHRDELRGDGRRSKR